MVLRFVVGWHVMSCCWIEGWVVVDRDGISVQVMVCVRSTHCCGGPLEEAVAVIQFQSLLE